MDILSLPCEDGLLQARLSHPALRPLGLNNCRKRSVGCFRHAIVDNHLFQQAEHTNVIGDPQNRKIGKHADGSQ